MLLKFIKNEPFCFFLVYCIELMNEFKEIKDSQLVVGYLLGDKKAMALLVKRWHKKFCLLAYKYTNNYDEAKDVVQDSWVVIMNNVCNLKDPNKFISWSMCIVTRKALDELNNKKREVKLEAYHLEVEQLPELEETNDKVKIRKAIKSLSVNQQIVLRLFYRDRQRLSDIAIILGVSVGTVKSRLFTAREKLKMIIKNKDYEKYK